MSGQVYALASGKGGVGKTTVTANLGVTLRSNGHSVALVDADLGMANLTTRLAVGAATTLHDVLAGDAVVEEALVERIDGFGVLPGTRELSGFAAADPDRLGAVLDQLATQYEYVLVDTGAGLSYEDVLPLGLADEVVLVTTPGSAAVGDTKKTAELVDLVDGEVRGVVVNRAIDGVDPAAVATDLDATLLGTIPDDPNVTDSELAGRPLEVHAPDSPAAAAFGRLAAVLAGEVDPADAADPAAPADPGDSSGPADGTDPTLKGDTDPTPSDATVRKDTGSRPSPTDGTDARETEEPGGESVADGANAEIGDGTSDEGGPEKADGDATDGGEAEDEESTTEESESKSSGILGWFS